MAFPKSTKKRTTKTKTKTASHDCSSDKHTTPPERNKKTNTKTKPTPTAPKKQVSFLNLPSNIRGQILSPEFRAYIPLETTYRRRGQTPAYMDGLAGLYRRAIPECVEDVEQVLLEAKDAVEELVGDPGYYC
ncbi:hypothetical protein FKW77_004857 [Venturia effusa]|uniref:Uncharacterized protein n=1 Tax=Venturia effusa TaxID=50376 RepID=A0A517KW90_9PEZI|nr:hypothetical protein FKW77_004857 [Venturia effusa]